MSDFAPNYTPRLRLKYSSQSKPHHMVWRLPRSLTDPTDWVTKMATFLSAFAANRYTDWTVLGCDYAEVDSDIFLPIDPPAPDAGGSSLSGVTAAAAAASISFVGRTVNGLRACFYVYGTSYFPDRSSSQFIDFRVFGSEYAGISSALTVLTETPPPLVGNDGATVVWYPYVNMKLNDHWVRKLRQG